jgi:2-methylcitrate dehydratase PrpD
MTSAQLNLSYCVAVLLLDGDVFVDQFTETALADPQRLALAAKIEAIEDPAITARGSKARHAVHVAVHLRGGALLEETVEAPRGSERHFASADDVAAKFAKLAGRVLPRDRVERLMETVLRLETLPDAGALMQALAW